MRYFLHLAYDGTQYHGWQIQPNTVTVQQELDRRLSQVLRQPVYCLGSGRTDSGVHASHQVAHFDAEVPESLDLPTLLYRLNRALPQDIRALAVHPVPAAAHARFDATARTYQYHVRLVPDPFAPAHTLYLDRAPDVEAMNEAAAFLVGEHDFTSFSKVKGSEKHYRCHCYEAGWHRVPGGLVFQIRANRFVRGMVRLVVGTLLDVGRGKLTPAQYGDVLRSLQRVHASGAAAAQGLFLCRVEYPAELVANVTLPVGLPYFAST
ncbi:tRNA pseudouridine(38-40) synthase TruA [Hymenobacter lutimineralis]|uniref:tRNA pseudouridine synthase A n=1 Tax=Hymenobacter lutimineralis TaxID=2606448 RepID=A0A5D6VA13_9BACT|nr:MULTISPECIES: tRNA pseudouridine(38-40) synthase TruA [Hymenobacter]QIX61487.1 tRNA pseudouridine(38-40) synthase TruA [Hymenobacter sp. BT18]TYZ11504.1 tRNA pseudouridine(38-40) synthase TruA [Hymenobacter lutimineralis]